MQQRRAYSFKSELSEREYNDLLDLSLSFCSQALVVIRGSCPLSSRGQDVLSKLEEFEISRERRSEWPGTRLHGADATVVIYKLCVASVSVLKQLSGDLYSWREPNSPEDLCLLRSDGTPWLVSIAHERDAYMELYDREVEAIRVDGHLLAEMLQLS